MFSIFLASFHFPIHNPGGPHTPTQYLPQEFFTSEWQSFNQLKVDEGVGKPALLLRLQYSVKISESIFEIYIRIEKTMSS